MVTTGFITGLAIGAVLGYGFIRLRRRVTRHLNQGHTR